MIALDAAWIAGHPLPRPEGKVDKNSRGRVVAVGGAATVPGALLLTGEAALRAGAGKVQLATIAAAATAIGVRFPEAAVFALDANADGQLDGGCAAQIVELLGRGDALVLGPGMGPQSDAEAMLRAVLGCDTPVPLVIDAAVLAAVPTLEDAVRAYSAAKVLTPHPGEMARMMGCDDADVGPGLAVDAAARFGATVVLKGSETWIATPHAPVLHYPGGGPGLATGGSGDVLAGIVGGLLARGAAPHVAAGWGVWTHGEAGRRLARDVGALGFLAREILPLIPRVMHDG